MVNDASYANDTRCVTEDSERNTVDKNTVDQSTVYNAEIKRDVNVENKQSSGRRSVDGDNIYTQFGDEYEEVFICELPENSDQVCFRKDSNDISTNDELRYTNLLADDIPHFSLKYSSSNNQLVGSNETLIQTEAHDINTIPDEAI
ncbi:hypothetical protein DPMN_186202 [Dreissena polymorpha]|uniref:Uncharacterized protein n=1 Tax=Dreissena polymorpha TaxID=45954 RepID=A0A9D4DLV5_DREPO|nr:hypothetical protein DPMN_186202 [Dreissena polymorpha]